MRWPASKAAAAQDAGRFVDEIVGVSLPQKKGDPIVFNVDEYLNRKTNAEALASLRPAFDKAGSVTAGNASGLNDGAAAVVVMSAKRLRRWASSPWPGLPPLGRVAWTPPSWGWGLSLPRARLCSAQAGMPPMSISSS